MERTTCEPESPIHDADREETLDTRMLQALAFLHNGIVKPMKATNRSGTFQ